MSQATIYHNPRCSKSRATLALLEQKHDDIQVIKYLEQPPSTETIESLVNQLGVNVRNILRRNEDDYKSNGFSDDSLSDAQIITLLHQHPKVLERPIVSYQGRAIIGRPPENVLSLFE